MANIHQNSSSDNYSQIYVFKVFDINCCEHCPKKLEEALMTKLRGIESVNIDATECLATVKVKGFIDSSEIIGKIRKWGKKAELVHERKETQPPGHNVELNDEDGHKDSSFRHKDSSVRHKFSFFRKRDKNKEKHDDSKSNVPSPKEIPDHICRDKYCTIHRRDDYPNMNYGTSYPRMNSYVPPPPMFAPPPQYGQYYGPRMFPPMTGYGMQRPMLRRSLRPDGFTNYSSHEYSNGCNNM